MRHVDPGSSVQAADDQEAAAVAPDSRILMVGQLGRPSPSFIEKLVAAEPYAQAGLTGTGECAFCGPDGALVAEHVDTLTSISTTTRPSRAGCARTVPDCRTEEGARAAYVDRLETSPMTGTT